jgi:hypothetical protein
LIRWARLMLATYALGWVVTFLPGDHPALTKAAALGRTIAE